jgi:hypothetical protein
MSGFVSSRAVLLACLAIYALGMERASAVDPFSAVDLPSRDIQTSGDSASSPSANWTADDVAQWSAAHSPAARAMESERSIVGVGMDREDQGQKAQVALIQSVYREMAKFHRSDSMGSALKAYYQAVAVREKKALLRQSAPILETLESMAGQARDLDIPDGDPAAISDTIMEMEDRWYQADYGYQRLLNQLAGLTGQKIDPSGLPVLSTPLPSSAETLLSIDEYLQAALANRSDLVAVETLCRCMNGKSLSAARSILGMLSPGAGMTALPTPPSGLMALHGLEVPTADLACRKMQCQQLSEMRRQQIQSEVRDRYIQLQEAIARWRVSQKRVDAKRNAVENAKRARELEQVPPGTELRMQLELFEYQAISIDRQLALAEAMVALSQATGALGHEATR